MSKAINKVTHRAEDVFARLCEIMDVDRWTYPHEINKEVEECFGLIVPRTAYTHPLIDYLISNAVKLGAIDVLFVNSEIKVSSHFFSFAACAAFKLPSMPIMDGLPALFKKVDDFYLDERVRPKPQTFN